MRDAYSRLSFILAARGLTLAALRERLRAQGDPLDSKTLARLAEPDRPIKQVETRVADALCRALAIDLTELIAFAPPLAPRLRELTPDQQARLTALLTLHTEGTLPPEALPELEALVAEADANELHNVRLLVAHRERLRADPTDQRHSAANETWSAFQRKFDALWNCVPDGAANIATRRNAVPMPVSTSNIFCLARGAARMISTISTCPASPATWQKVTRWSASIRSMTAQATHLIPAATVGTIISRGQVTASSYRGRQRSGARQLPRCG